MMPMLPKHRAFLPACLALGTLLCALPAPADMPPVPVAAPTAESIPLQHTVPGDILKTMHWDQAAHLPPGVTQITALPATNSLSVVATPAGLAQIRQIIRVMDIEPRQVQIKFALANATAADLDASGVNFDLVPSPEPEVAAKPGMKIPKGAGQAPYLGYATGKEVTALLQAVTKQGTVTQAPILSTSNNVDASITLSSASLLQVVSSVTFAVTPRVNSDDTVTLALRLSFPDGPRPLAIKTLRTVPSGGTMVVAWLPPPAAAGGKTRLVFVTPTILGNPFPSAAPKK